jgi:hypothetical protein
VSFSPHDTRDRRHEPCGVPKLCSQPVIIRICTRNRVLTSHTDDAENSEVDRPDNLNTESRAGAETCVPPDDLAPKARIRRAVSALSIPWGA